MKKWTRFLGLLVLATVLVLATGCEFLADLFGGAGGIGGDAYEPNNSRSEAYLVALGTPYSAAIGDIEDDDFFQF